jgi:peptide/nickel transport system permease protein
VASVQEQSPALEPVPASPEVGGRQHLGHFFRSNWKLSFGLLLVICLLSIGIFGRFFVTEKDIKLGVAPFAKAPTADYPLGTDSNGRNLFAQMVFGLPITLEIGLIAAAVGTAIGTFFGLVTGYYRGPIDTIVRSTADIMMTIPSLMVLVVIASFVSTTVQVMAIIIAAFSWPWSVRAIRAQTLSMREQAFVRLSKLSGRSDLEIILLDLLPNLLPYIIAGFVGAVNGAILTSVGLQLLGLGPLNEPTLGLTLNYSFQSAAILRGMWWWWLPPAIVLAVLFVGLFFISIALDEIANPRLRGVGA